ncbi:MAG: GntR family transcriptional regulator [Paracoccaceae bacterium]|jgi:GntR family histidine utilization transcriptional repressor|nr:GntR family transcriptional regulator [Paracoccaceae bacterium]
MAASNPTEKTSYRDVKADILGRITEGTWGPGVLLPGEVELAETFGVARATVNRAMRELSEEGFIDRRRKAGTRVRQSPIRAARFEIPIVRAEIEATGAAYRYGLLERETLRAPDWIRARLGLLKGAKVLHLMCLHSAGGAPYQLEDRWINLAALPEAERADFSDSGPNEWLVAAVPYSEVEISFLATAAEGAVAAYLGMREGEPVFTVERTTWWEGQAITHVRLSFSRGHRMTTRY